jgi:hypothetical protein
MRRQATQLDTPWASSRNVVDHRLPVPKSKIPSTDAVVCIVTSIIRKYGRDQKALHYERRGLGAKARR